MDLFLFLFQLFHFICFIDNRKHCICFNQISQFIRKKFRYFFFFCFRNFKFFSAFFLRQTSRLCFTVAQINFDYCRPGHSFCISNTLLIVIAQRRIDTNRDYLFSLKNHKIEMINTIYTKAIPVSLMCFSETNSHDYEMADQGWGSLNTRRCE